MKIPELFFMFDVESIGLHGEGFAVAGGVYTSLGSALHEFKFSCPPESAEGSDSDRKWVSENIPVIVDTHRTPRGVRGAFWTELQDAKRRGAIIISDCGWPVEANFLEACILDGALPLIESCSRGFEGPYPFHEMASFLIAAGMNPMDEYDRNPSEMPKHDPLADARQSMRILSKALDKIQENGQ